MVTTLDVPLALFLRPALGTEAVDPVSNGEGKTYGAWDPQTQS